MTLEAVMAPDADRRAGEDALARALARARNGDAAAAAHVVRALAPRLVRVAVRILADAAEAEDVAQETLARVWTKAPGWNLFGPARIETWAHRVAINLSVDRLRRRARLDVTDAPPEQEDGGPAPDAGLEARETAAQVQAALAALPDRQRVALTLVHFEELPGREAAAALGVTVEALESLLARARRTLRARLAHVHGDLS